MKFISYLLLLASASLWAADRPPVRLADLSLLSRVGFDSNPLGTGGTSATILGDEDTLTFALGANVGLALINGTADQPSLKASYTGEAVRFDRWASENHSTHRLGLGGQFKAGRWTFIGEGASLYVAGHDETLPSVSSINANALPLWRERRRQWQHRVRLHTQADFDRWLVRGTGSLLDYDYHTQPKVGWVAYADRSDAQAALELGWKQNSRSLWLTGVRLGRQNQAVIPLPNYAFDYSSDYSRVTVGWEGRLPASTTVTFAAGPDFRRYTGAIDPRVFLGGRDRTSLWFEGGFTSKPLPALTLTGKAVRVNWLSSTGKSACMDTSAETSAAWALTTAWTVRLTTKVHRCDYNPTVRDDWESFVTAGAALKLNPRTFLTLDVLRHHAWNNVPATSEREFQRCAITLGSTIKL